MVTGGAGYIGSHTVLMLLQAGYDVVVLDNLCNSSDESLRRLAKISGFNPIFIKGDILDDVLLDSIFARHDICTTIHFAGLKSVSDSIADPLSYYQNNVGGTIKLCRAMAKAGVFKMVFSSSATVYGIPQAIPISESVTAMLPTNPYGRSKLVAEQVLSDLLATDSRWAIALLRYFNPVGAHESGLIGEDPRGTPANLLPYICQVGVGKFPELVIFGDDYSTADGTGVRDYVHVMDLAEGHLKALEFIQSSQGIVGAWNLGTGRGYSVLEVLQAFEQFVGISIPYRFAPRRSGDIEACWADCDRAKVDFGWFATRGLEAMLVDAWRWQSRNPNGYQDVS